MTTEAAPRGHKRRTRTDQHARTRDRLTKQEEVTRRRNAARRAPADAPTPSAIVRCPRHLWPTLWTALGEAACNLWTGKAQPSPCPERNVAAPVEVHLTRRGLEVARKHGLTPDHEVTPADRLDAAIAAEVERIAARATRMQPEATS